MDVKNKNITVVGLARSGFSAALLLHRLGARVSVTDSGDTDELKRNRALLSGKGIAVELGGHTPEFISGRDLLIVSPGVNDQALPLAVARKKKIPILDEVELAASVSRAPIVAVTGTNGKSTVVSLIGEILNNAGKKAITCGNIGNPFSGEVTRLTTGAVAILEVSSFQLQRTVNFRPTVSCLLNMAQNHLDRHASLDEYFQAKAKIFQNQNEHDWTILNYDEPQVRRLAKLVRAKVLYFSKFEPLEGAFVASGQIVVRLGKKEKAVLEVSRLGIKGEHNLENALCASLVGTVFGAAPGRIAEALTRFKGLEHRCEEVAEVDGVKFINDSKATTVAATCRALQGCSRPVILIAGGRDKQSDFRAVYDLIEQKVKQLILIGEAKEKIRRTLQGAAGITEAKNLHEAVSLAYASAESGDCVILSPMCASFDMFRDFEERGRKFKEAVETLNHK